jgi:hypothetical protein
MSRNIRGKTMKVSCLKGAAAAVAILITFAAPAAHAQYVWLNEKGVKQFSDQPPPASVPKNRILKSPAGGFQPPPRESASDTPADAAPAAKEADKGPMTTAERNAEFQKRKKEQAENEQKAAEKEKQAAEKAKYCDQLRSYSRSLNSGDRITKADPKTGEKVYLSDEQRAAEAREAQSKLAGCS